MTDVEKINLDNIIARLLEGLFFFFFGIIIEYGPWSIWLRLWARSGRTERSSLASNFGPKRTRSGRPD